MRGEDAPDRRGDRSRGERGARDAPDPRAERELRIESAAAELVEPARPRKVFVRFVEGKNLHLSHSPLWVENREDRFRQGTDEMGLEIGRSRWPAILRGAPRENDPRGRRRPGQGRDLR